MRLALTTHDEGGLSDLDVALADRGRGTRGGVLVISAIVAVTVFAVIVATIVLFARDPGPEPAEIAISYELAWDRLDFEALWAMSGDEMRDGLDKKRYVAAKRAAYAGRPDLGNLIDAGRPRRRRTSASDTRTCRTRVTLHGGDVLHNDILLTRRSSAWVVTGYELAPDPQQTV